MTWVQWEAWVQLVRGASLLWVCLMPSGLDASLAGVSQRPQVPITAPLAACPIRG